MVVTLGQQYNVGEKPTVILYNYIRHATHGMKTFAGSRALFTHVQLEELMLHSMFVPHVCLISTGILNSMYCCARRVLQITPNAQP